MLALVAIAAIFFAISPQKIGRVPLNLATASLFGLAVIWLAGAVDGDALRFGILGTGTLAPWKILIIFFAAAYASVSADITGMFDAAAYKIAHFARGKTWRLFVFFYLFASVMTIFTSNDVVILTLTPIIFYLGKHAKINILPFLFAEFFAANTLSMALLIGNPTNIIVGDALGLGFWEYSRTMAGPTLVAALGNFAILAGIFWKKIRGKFELRSDSRFAIRHPADVGISAALLAGLLGTLIFSERLGLEIWEVTLGFAAAFFVEDAIFSGLWVFWRRRHFGKPKISQISLPAESNEVLMAARRIPWGILPFLVLFFVIVGALGELGILEKIGGLAADFFGGSPLSGALGMGIFGALLANIVNNQPATILLAGVLGSAPVAALPAETARAMAFGVVIASNLAANLTILGALAGLMWRRILSEKGIAVSYFDFLKIGAIVTPIILVATILTMVAMLPG